MYVYLRQVGVKFGLFAVDNGLFLFLQILQQRSRLKLSLWLRMGLGFESYCFPLFLNSIPVLFTFLNKLYSLKLFLSHFLLGLLIFIFYSLVQDAFMVHGQVFELILISIADLGFYSNRLFFIYCIIYFWLLKLHWRF